MSRVGGTTRYRPANCPPAECPCRSKRPVEVLAQRPGSFVDEPVDVGVSIDATAGQLSVACKIAGAHCRSQKDRCVRPRERHPTAYYASRVSQQKRAEQPSVGPRISVSQYDDPSWIVRYEVRDRAKLGVENCKLRSDGQLPLKAFPVVEAHRRPVMPQRRHSGHGQKAPPGKDRPRRDGQAAHHHHHP